MFQYFCLVMQTGMSILYNDDLCWLTCFADTTCMHLKERQCCRYVLAISLCRHTIYVKKANRLKKIWRNTDCSNLMCVYECQMMLYSCDKFAYSDCSSVDVIVKSLLSDAYLNITGYPGYNCIT